MESTLPKKELDEKDLAFLISLLDSNDKKDLVETFSDVFYDMMKEGLLSKSWYYKMRNGYAPSDDLVLKACRYDDKVTAWIINKVKEKIARANEILSKV